MNRDRNPKMSNELTCVGRTHGLTPGVATVLRTHWTVGLLGCAALGLLACGGPQDQAGESTGDAVETVDEPVDMTGETEGVSSYTVSFRGRDIDLEPYVQGFPYGGFQVDVEHGRMLYLHETPEGDFMQYQALPLDGEIDLTQGRQLSDIDWSTRSFWGAHYHPTSGDYFVVSDEANEERINLYRMSMDDGSVTPLTDNDYTYAASFSPDESTLAYVARNGTEEPFNSCLHLRNLEDNTDRQLVCDEGSSETRFTWSDVSFLPDGSGGVVRLQHNLDRNQESLAFVDFTADEPELELLLEAGVVRYYIWVIEDSMTDEGFLYGSEESGFGNIYRYDFDSGEGTQLTHFTDELSDVVIVGEDPSLLVAVLKRPYESILMVLDGMTGDTLYETTDPANIAIQDHNGPDLVWTASSIRTPYQMERVQVELGDGGYAFVRQPVSGIPHELADQIIQCDVERVSFPTFDTDADGNQRMLHGYLLTPSDERPEVERMVRITSFYGGGNSFSTSAQIMCEAGVATFSPAPRGSWGFGAEFAALNDGDLGGDEIVDIIFAAQWLVDERGYRPDQVGVYGGSHGGYATMRALTFPPETNGRNASFDFGFGMSHAGFSNIISFYETCNIPDWVLLEAGDPATETERLLDRSPISHAHLLSSPLLLTHGENDSRVPVTESRTFAEAASAAGAPVTYIEFAGQGHGIDGLDNTMTYYQTLFTFLTSVVDGWQVAATELAP